VALVCLHSGIFTRAQFCAHLGAPDAPACIKHAERFVKSLLAKKLAGEEPFDGLPTTTRPCRITHKSIYRSLRIPDVRHRRTASAGVLGRRLLSLDYVLEHQDQPWLPTEQEKVAALEALDIPKELFPKRTYAGKASHVSRYFALKLPVALDDAKATFVYVDPGRDTDTELLSWGAEHAKLWAALRDRDHPVNVVAVARDDIRQGRAAKVLRRWTRSGEAAEYQPLSDEENEEIRRIEQIVLKGNLEDLDRWGGFKAAIRHRNMLQNRPTAQAPPAKNRIRVDQVTTWISPRFPAEPDSW